MNQKILRDAIYVADHVRIPAIAGTCKALAEGLRAHEDEIGDEMEAIYAGAIENLKDLDILLSIADPFAQPYPLRQRQLAAVSDVLAKRLQNAAAEIRVETDAIEGWAESARKRLADKADQDARTAALNRTAEMERQADRLAPWEIVRDAEACGVALSADDSGAIRVSPPNRLGDPHLTRINHRRAHVVAFLQERQATVQI